MSEVMTKLSVEDIQYAIWRSLGGGSTECIPNVSFGFFKSKSMESDLLYITPYRYLHEFEIKRSWSDFLADFKKPVFHSDVRIMHLTFVLPVALAGDGLRVWCEENYKSFRRSFDIWFYDEEAKVYRPNVFTNGKFCSRTYLTEDMENYINHRDADLPYRRRLFAEELSELYRLCMVRYWNRYRRTNSSDNFVGGLASPSDEGVK